MERRTSNIERRTSKGWERGCVEDQPQQPELHHQLLKTWDSSLSSVLRLVPLCPAHSRAPSAVRYANPQ